MGALGAVMSEDAPEPTRADGERSPSSRSTVPGPSADPIDGRVHEPGSLAEWWLHVFRGWPDGLPVTPVLLRRAKYNLMRTSVNADLKERFRRANAGVGYVRPITTAPILGFWLFFQPVVLWANSPSVLLLVLTPGIALQLAWAWWQLKRIYAPRLRASLRREGVNCCVRCGHMIGLDEPASTCPECGLDHRDLPLGWGPGEIGAAR